MDVLLWLQKSTGLQTAKAIVVPTREKIPAVLLEIAQLRHQPPGIMVK
jgi:hypothetical protein